MNDKVACAGSGLEISAFLNLQKSWRTAWVLARGAGARREVQGSAISECKRHARRESFPDVLLRGARGDHGAHDEVE